MKVGDLVELSSQGKRLGWLKALQGKHGIITKDHEFRLSVLWFDKDNSKGSYHWHTIARSSLKHVR